MVSVPSKFSPSAKMPEIVRTFWTQCENAENFLIIFVQFQCDLQKKKGHHADGGIFFSDFMLISKKKGPSSEFSNFSPRFLRHTRARRHESRLSTVFGGKQKRRFLAEEKTPEFAKFQYENARKNFALFCAYREHCRWYQRLNKYNSQSMSCVLTWWFYLFFAWGHSTHHMHSTTKSCKPIWCRKRRNRFGMAGNTLNS